jgi:hypothetical protein
MNVKLKLKMSQLTEIIKAIQEDRLTEHPSSLVEKASYYLYRSALKKLLKKQIDKTDLTKEGTFTVSFSYPEAYTIYCVLLECNCVDVYRASVVRNASAKLHQNLQSA